MVKGFQAVVPLLAALVTASPTLLDSARNERAPLISSSSVQSAIIPDSYIVVLKKHVTVEAATAHQNWVQDFHVDVENQRNDLKKRQQVPIQQSMFDGLKHTYAIAGGILGYSGHFDDKVLDAIRMHPDVDYVERDQELHTWQSAADPTIQNSAPWGLARISHRDTLTFGTYNKYIYGGDGGEGVDAYVIDTGTYTEHVEFEGRARWGITIPTGDGDVDGYGHGTHCSGTIAGKRFGVAKKANIIAVKVLRSSGYGSTSDILKGVEWVTDEHIRKVKAAKKSKKPFKGSVANMSLGGYGRSQSLESAVNAAVENGVHMVVAAGNDNADSCYYSPAAAEKVITAGASTLSDERAYFSNYGKCNDIFAPGLNVQSAWIGSEYATNIISGTSMATPHIVGLLAYYLSLQPSDTSAYSVGVLSPEKLKTDIIAIATKDILTNVPDDTPNLLIWNGGGNSNYTEILNKGSYPATK